MLGPFATASRLTPIHQGSLAVLSPAAFASMSTTSTMTTTTTTTTTTTRDRGDRYGPWNGPNNLTKKNKRKIRQQLYFFRPRTALSLGLNSTGPFSV